VRNSPDPVWLITDQPRYAGVAGFARQLVEHVHPPGVPLELASMSYVTDQHATGSRVITRRYAHSKAEVPFCRWVNSRAARSWIRDHGRQIHAIGYEYSIVGAAERSLCTLHGLYWMFPSAASGLRGFLSDLYHDAQTLELLRYLRAFDEIVVPSQNTAGMAESVLGLATTVIHHSVDRGRFRPRDRAHSRRALGLPLDRVIVLNVSAWGRNKNLPTLARVAERLPPEYLLVKLGAPVRGANVTSLGPLSAEQYPLVFDAADVYLHTSTNEGFGHPLTEALASGIPVVSPSCATGEEILGRNPLLVEDPFDVKAYLRALATLRDPGTYHRACEYSTARAGRFEIGPWREQYERVYARVFGG
jgi:glycosyltransferase involved in cell wall biosynthesis